MFFATYVVCFTASRKVLRAKNVVFQYIITADFDIFDPPTPFIGTLEPVLEVKPMPSMAPRTHQLWMARKGRTTCRPYSLSSQGSLRHAVKAYDQIGMYCYF